MALDETDIELGKLNPDNAPLRRARRVIEGKIAELECELRTWEFVRDALDHEIDS